MEMIIQHNMLSANANRNLGLSNRKKAGSTEKLASGYKINKAADDAAGLKISEKMRSQIRGLDQASTNIETAENYVKVADGALAEVTEILQRIRELSVQASNDATLCVEDKQAIQDEISQLTVEMERIFNDTEFNHKRIWRQPTDWHHNVTSVSRKEYALTMKVPSPSPLPQINNTNRGAVPQTPYRLHADTDGVTVSWTGWNDKTYVSEVIPYEGGNPKNGLVAGAYLDDYFKEADFPEIEKNKGFHIPIAYEANPNATAEQVIAGLNLVSIRNSYNSSERLTLYDQNGNAFLPERIDSTVDIKYHAELKWNRDMEIGDTSFMQGSETNLRVPDNDTNLWRITFTMDDGNGNTATVTSTPTIMYTCDDRTEKPDGEPATPWWHWVYPSNNRPRYKSGISYSGAVGGFNNGSQGAFLTGLVNGRGHNMLNNSQNPSHAGGSITMSFNLNVGTTNIGNITLTTHVKYGELATAVLDRIKSIKGIDVYNNVSENKDDTGLTNSSIFYNYGNNISYNQFEIPAEEEHIAEDFQLNIQSGPNPWEHIKLKYKYLDNKVLGINDLKVDTYDHAQETLAACDKALLVVLGERSNFGAYQNRFEHARAVNDITAENTQSAESIIRDTDMASEMVKFAKENILEQAGMSMLTQANQLPQRVLALLQ